MKKNLIENYSIRTILLYAEYMLICQTAKLALIAFLTICSYSTGMVHLGLTLFPNYAFDSMQKPGLDIETVLESVLPESSWKRKKINSRSLFLSTVPQNI